MKTDNKTIDELSGLIARDMLGTLAEHEKERLEALSAEYGLLPHMKQQIAERIASQDAFDAKKAYEDSKQHRVPAAKPRRSLRRGLAVAAAAAVVAVALVLWPTDTVQESDQTEAISPGRSFAIVTLPDGGRVEVDPQGGDIHMESDGAVISSEAGRLRYDDSQVATAAANVFNTVYVPRGREFTVELADGTSVWLNSDTELRFPVRFDGANREVFIRGEAYLEVAEDTGRPFLAHTSAGTVRVIGTKFNIRDYSEERTVVATLVSGQVEYMPAKAGDRPRTLAPGDQLTDARGSGLDVKRVDTSLYTGWKDGRYVFEDISLEEIMRTLNRWYDIELAYACEEVKHLRFSGDLKRYDNINVFLDLIETGGDVEFAINGKHITVDTKRQR
ncbi:DUF4974 domain-containing protein [Alistipes sp. OttesenSCG-928-B03]|nr:DUF4974 domain-containing protein [Alistipes sp. OttesenSCG-928-B03]